jgi:hypothetical protein
MALELHNLPPWSEDSKKAVVQQLQLDVRKTLSTKPDIRPPVVQFHTSIGVPEPIYEELGISKSEIRLLDLVLTSALIGLEAVGLELDSPSLLRTGPEAALDWIRGVWSSWSSNAYDSSGSSASI